MKDPTFNYNLLKTSAINSIAVTNSEALVMLLISRSP